MVTLFASIVGFFTSIIPEILKLIKDKHDKAHELKMLEKQVEYSKILNENQIEKILLKKDFKEYEMISSLYNTYNTGISWIDSINGTVRPLLTYCFFSLYVCFKILQYKQLSHTAHIIEYMDILWSIDDQTIFAGIISFYFGQRTFSRIIKK